MSSKIMGDLLAPIQSNVRGCYCIVRSQRLTVIPNGAGGGVAYHTDQAKLLRKADGINQPICYHQPHVGTKGLADGHTLTAAIARRDVLRMRQGATDALLRSVGSPQFRARGAEIKFVPTVAVPELQARRDALAKRRVVRR